MSLPTNLLSAAGWPDPVLDADAVADWPAGAVDRLVALGLLAGATPAGSYPCDACGLDHVEPVQWVHDPDIPSRAFVVCPEEGPVRVDPAALRRWAVRLPALAAGVAAAVGATGGVTERVPGRVWKVGIVRAGGRVWAGWLAAGLDRPDAAAVVDRVPDLRAPNALVLVTGAAPPAAVWAADRPPAVVPLADLLTLTTDGLAADRLVLDSAAAPAGAAVAKGPAVTVPAPPGATWADVTLTVGDHHLTVRVGGVAERVGFADAGFEDRRAGGVPDQRWVLLGLLAKHGGTLGTGDRVMTKRGELKQAVSELRGRLRALVGVEGDPFHPTGRGKPYRTRFTVRPAEGGTCPTPPGTTWDDLTLAALPDGRVEVAVTVDARDVAWGEDGRSEGAAVAGERRTTHPPAEFGLTAPAAAALAAVLRAGGRLAGPGDDPALLALGAALSRFFGLTGSPFEYREADRLWVARFEAAPGQDR